MRKIKEVLRLKWSKNLSNRRIASSCGIARPTVSDYLRRAESAGLSWPLPADLDDSRLERLLFPAAPYLDATCTTLDQAIDAKPSEGFTVPAD